jgi:hypothetical protein
MGTIGYIVLIVLGLAALAFFIFHAQFGPSDALSRTPDLETLRKIQEMEALEEEGEEDEEDLKNVESRG